ncbi:MAG TPA: hypothetical protein VGY32_05260 [Solirubrobacteraceae bacterium]|nr:hypothetical protein [Solirubrobacteraceae bacterium]
MSYVSQRSRQREQRENTREAIIEATETLLREQPYRALNLMSEACLLDTFGQEPLGDPNVALATLETIWLRVLAPK